MIIVRYVWVTETIQAGREREKIKHGAFLYLFIRASPIPAQRELSDSCFLCQKHQRTSPEARSRRLRTATGHGSGPGGSSAVVSADKRLLAACHRATLSRREASMAAEDLEI